MARTAYRHSAYWYAYHYGWTYSEAQSWTGQYLDIHTYRPRMRERPDGAFRSKDWFKWRNSAPCFDSTFNPLMFCACAMVDVGHAMRDGVSKLADPAERARMKRELVRDLRRFRRPFYYERETERRRRLAVERRKISRRATSAPMPTPEEVLAAWNARKESREAMIRLGGMLHDLECYVDNCLRFDESGDVIGRNGGIKGWLDEKIPELLPKYKTLMRYKAMAVRLRQATETKDPKPTSALLDETPRNDVVAKLLEDPEPVFSRIFAALDHMLSPETVFLDAPKEKMRRKTSGRIDPHEEGGPAGISPAMTSAYATLSKRSGFVLVEERRAHARRLDTSSAVRSRQAPGFKSSGSAKPPTFTRFSASTTRCAAEHILRICRLRPSLSTNFRRCVLFGRVSTTSTGTGRMT